MRYRSSRSTAVSSAVLALVIVAHAGILLAYDEPQGAAEEVSRRAEFIVRGMLKERERLVSGVAKYSGKKHSADEDRPDVDGITTGFWAFDLSRNWLRYDNDEPVYVRAINAEAVAKANNDAKQAVDDAPRQQATALLRYVRNGDYSASWNRTHPIEGNSLFLRAIDAPMGGATEYHHYHDVRASGLLEYMTFLSGSLDRGLTVKTVCENLLALPVRELTTRGDVTTIVFQDDVARRTLAVDVAHGFAPIEFTVRGLNDPAVQKCQSEWKEVNDVWVPTRVVVELDAPHVGMSGRLDVEYEWEDVNQEIDPAYFTYLSFDVPQEVDVIDTRVPNPVRIGTLKKGTLVEVDDSASASPDSGDVPPFNAGRGRFRLWLILANAGIVVSLLAVRRFWKRSALAD